MEEVMEVLMERSPAAGSPHSSVFTSSCILPADTDFSIDDQVCVPSALEVSDRLTYLEQRVQMQDDEIQLLKMTMADVLKRLELTEEHTHTHRAPARAVRPVSLALPPKASSASVPSLRKSSSSTLPSSPSSRNYSTAATAAGKRTPAGAAKEPPSAKAKVSSSTGRKLLETKPKEGGAGGSGSRRVTHCKVTMQISLTLRSGSSGSAEACPSSLSSAPDHSKADPIQKRSFQSYKSPVKSPSQYFQICY